MASHWAPCIAQTPCQLMLPCSLGGCFLLKQGGLQEESDYIGIGHPGRVRSVQRHAPWASCSSWPCTCGRHCLPSAWASLSCRRLPPGQSWRGMCWGSPAQTNSAISDSARLVHAAACMIGWYAEITLLTVGGVATQHTKSQARSTHTTQRLGMQLQSVCSGSCTDLLGSRRQLDAGDACLGVVRDHDCVVS